MRKSILAIMAAMFAVTAVMSACSNNDAPAQGKVQISGVAAQAPKK